MENRRILESWKAISDYLGRAERTCRKWEHELDLPIHRMEDSPRARVFAYVDELDRWKEEKLRPERSPTVRGLFAPGRKARIWLIAASAVVILAVGGLLVRQTQLGQKPSGSQTIKSVAVLPFIDLSPGQGNEHLGDGIADILINALNGIEGLRVPARTSAFYFKGKDVRPEEIGLKLKVEWILEGSVQVYENRLRVVATLLSASDGNPLWTEKYDRSAVDIFAVEDDIARMVVDNLKIKILGEKRGPLVKRYTNSPEANDLFMKGQHFFQQGLLSFPQAIECFEQAVDKDPNFALAFAWMGMSYEYLGYGGHLPVEEMASKAKESSLKALEIDSEIVEAVTTLAGLKSRYEWDFAGAETEFRRAIRINPNYPLARRGYCLLLSCLGRHEESIAENRKALELDPFSSEMTANLADRLIYARKFDQAIEVAKKGLELDPYQVGFFMNLVKTHSLTGRFDEAHQVIARHDELLRLKGWEEVKIRYAHASQSALVYALEGRRKQCLEQIEIIKDSIRNKVFTISVIIAYAYGALGEKDEAFAWLEKAFQAREPYLIYLNVNPQGDSLRGDPRFTDLVLRIGLEK